MTDLQSQLIIHDSSLSISQILEKLKKIFQTKGISIFALVDHSDEAHKAGLKLQDEKLLIFGDPKTGTYLMQENPAIGIELPLKILIWEDPNKGTQLAYKDPIYLGELYGINKNANILVKMKEALETLIDQVKN